MGAGLREYLQIEKTRHGKVVYYFRRNRENRIRLPAPDDPRFEPMYEALLHRKPGYVPPKISCPKSRALPSQRQRVERALKRMLSGARQRAKKKKLPCTITLDWLLSRAVDCNFRCEVTGIPFYAVRTANSRAGNPSVDRIDNSRGYEPDNCRLVLVAVNSMLGDWGEEIFSYVARQATRKMSQRIANILPPPPDPVRE